MSKTDRILGVVLAAGALILAACTAEGGDSSGIRIVQRTPEEFCRGTARSVAIERYGMKTAGLPLQKALEASGGVAVIDAVTKSVYGANIRSAAQAADTGTAACLAYFR